MLHNTRFNQEFITRVQETNPKKLASALKEAVRKAEKDVKKRKLDRLSEGFMRLMGGAASLQEKESVQTNQKSMTIEEDSSK